MSRATREERCVASFSAVAKQRICGMLATPESGAEERVLRVKEVPNVGGENVV